jgi:hypothetical protein
MHTVIAVVFTRNITGQIVPVLSYREAPNHM